jgi:hypothetical protein
VLLLAAVLQRCGAAVLRCCGAAVLRCGSFHPVTRSVIAVCGVEFGSASMPSASSARVTSSLAIHARSA